MSEPPTTRPSLLVRLRDRFTSFDDGAPGIADALWRLWAVTGDRRYRRAALAGMRAEERLAEAPAGARCPRRYCRWPYDPGAGDETIRTGIGEGNAGIAYAYDVFAQRSGDRRFERYATSSAAYLERLITRQGAMPWAVGRRHYILGFLGGAAGDAFMFLRLYRHTGQRRWLRDARRLLGWVARRARSRRAGIDWPIFLDARRPGPAGRRAATGSEEGAGLIMGGKRPVVLIQSTGFFESGDSIRGMCLDLHLPLLLMIGYRGYAGQGRPPADSAARYLEPMLDAWGIPHHVVDSDTACRYISDAYEQAQDTSHPVAVLMGKEYDV